MKSNRLLRRLVFLAAMLGLLTSCGEDEVPVHLDHDDCCGVSDWGPVSLDSTAT